MYVTWNGIERENAPKGEGSYKALCTRFILWDRLSGKQTAASKAVEAAALVQQGREPPVFRRRRIGDASIKRHLVENTMTNNKDQ